MAGLSSTQIQDTVKQGARPPLPDGSSLAKAGWPADYVKLVTECWSDDPAQRPAASAIVERLTDMLVSAPEETVRQGDSRSLVFATKITAPGEFKAMHASFLTKGRADPITLPSDTAIIFTDIAGFTAMSETLEPIEVANMLSKLFGLFDALVEAGGGVKYKTIGDAYLVAVTRATSEAVEPALAATSIALKMAAAASEVEIKGPDGRPKAIAIRAGVHVGPVALQLVSLDTVELLGDTMNMAARMEQTSEAGKVQVSEAVYSLTKGNIRFSQRRLVSIKGKGDVATHFAHSLT